MAVAAAAVVAMRRGYRLRQPTSTQLDDIAAPLARISVRHVPAGLLHEDLADAVLAASAVGAYITDGPLLELQPTEGDLPDYADGEEYR